jgi:hypothetical protein
MESANVADRVLLVSSADTKFFALLREMISSLERLPKQDLPRYDLAVFDLGLSPKDRSWLNERDIDIAVPHPHDGQGSSDRPLELAFLVRPHLRDYFPDYDVYVWIDSDVWVQAPDVLSMLIDGALRKGMAIAHENERGYRFQRALFLWTAKHFLLGYGVLRGAWLLTRPHLNAGLFAIRADAPHWRVWGDRYRAAIRRTGKLTPHDQFALNQAIYQDRLPTEILPASANWICDRGVPMWNDESGEFCEPYPPFRPIAALHLAGPGKRTVYRIRRTGGAAFNAMIRFGMAPP